MQVMPRSIVIGVDFGEQGDLAIAESLRLYSCGWATTLYPVHVLDPRDIVDGARKSAFAAAADELALAPALLLDRVRELASTLIIDLPDEVVKPHAFLGRPAEAIIQAAVDLDADLIVVGTHGRKGFERFMLGSTAESLVQRATCPVFVARATDHTLHSKTELPVAPYAPGEEPQYVALHETQIYVTRDSASNSDGPTGFRTV